MKTAVTTDEKIDLINEWFNVDGHDEWFYNPEALTDEDLEIFKNGMDHPTFPLDDHHFHLLTDDILAKYPDELTDHDVAAYMYEYTRNLMEEA